MGGGVDKSHGVGITSGLSGGRSNYGVGGTALKIGDKIMDFIDPRRITKGKEVTEEVMGTADDVAHPLLGGSGEGIMKTITKIKDPTKRMMALRALSSVGGGAGVVSSMFDEPDPSAAETPIGAGFQRLRQGLELATAINPLLQTGNIAKNIYEATKPFGEGDFTLTPAGAIRSAMGKTGSDIVEEQEDTGGGDVQDVVNEMTQEEMIRDEYFKKLGYEVYKRNNYDGGIDIRAVKKDGSRLFVQCKHPIESGNPIGADVVRELEGSVELEKKDLEDCVIDKMIITSTRYTFKAVEAARKLNIELKTTDDIK